MYIPQGIYATSHRMRLLLAACSTMQSVLGVDSAEDAAARVHTYGEEVTEANVPVLEYPTALIRDMEVHVRSGSMGEFMGVDQRTIECWIAFYVPEHEDIESISDEKAWVDEQFSGIVLDCLELTGKGESVAGETHLHVMNPVYEGCEREPDDERGDTQLDPHPELPRWFGLLMWEVH